LLDPLSIASKQANTRGIVTPLIPLSESNTEVYRMGLASAAFLVGAVILLIPQYLAIRRARHQHAEHVFSLWCLFGLSFVIVSGLFAYIYMNVLSQGRPVSAAILVREIGCNKINRLDLAMIFEVLLQTLLLADFPYD